MSGKNCYTLIEYFGDPPRTVYRSKKASENPGRGRRFTFHGSFTSKQKAKEKEKEVGGFIREKNGRYYVLREI